jgi:hypothetical protein
MVIQELTQRTATIETAICNAKWKPGNTGQYAKERERWSTDSRKRGEKHNTEEEREKEEKWLSK